METQAITAGALRPWPEIVPAAATPAEVDAFDRALTGPVPLPEATVAVRLQDKVQEIGRVLAGAREGPADPAGMLVTQTAMVKSLIEVDLIAKAAGSLSQGINKLVNMQ